MIEDMLAGDGHVNWWLVRWLLALLAALWAWLGV